MATSKTLTALADRYPVGTSVGAYREANWNTNEPFSGAPKGSSDATGTIASDGSVALTGLTTATRYVLVNSSGTRVYTHFDSFDVTRNGGVPAGEATSVDPGVVEIGDIQTSARAALEFSTFNIADPAYGAVGDVRRVSDVSATNLSATITSATAAFTSADVGKAIVIHNGAGGGVALKTTIQSITNATTAVLTNAAGTTTTNLVAVFGTDDTAHVQAAIDAAGAVSGRFWDTSNRSARFVDVVVPRGIYYVNNLTCPNPWVRFIGLGGGAFIKNANGPMFTVSAQGIEFHRCDLDGNANGNTPDYTGNGITCSGAHDDFKFFDGRISNVDPAAYAIQYASVTSTRKEINRSHISKYGSPSASAAIGYPGTAGLNETAGSSKVVDCEAESGSLLDLSGCSSVTVMGNILGSIYFDANSEVARIVGNRIFGASTIRGSQHILEANAIGATITLGSNCSNSRVGASNVFAADPVDSSTTPLSNLIEEGCANAWRNVRSKTTAYTLTRADHIIQADATSAAFTITLPAASSYGNKEFIVKKTDATANVVTIGRTGSDTIDGATSKAITTQYDSLTLTSDGTAWYVA